MTQRGSFAALPPSKNIPCHTGVQLQGRRMPPADAVNPAPAHTSQRHAYCYQRPYRLGQQERHEVLGWWMRELEKGMCGTPIHCRQDPNKRTIRAEAHIENPLPI